MSDTPTHPELCENCNPLVESSKLEWVKVGGMNIGLHRQPLTWVLRDKYSDDVIKMNAEYSQQLAAKSRELADMTKQLTAVTDQPTNRTMTDKLLPHEKDYLKKLVTHTPDKCEGRNCCVHNPSDHHMRNWLMIFRFDKGVMERICPEHGVGHPDPDDLAFWISVDCPHMEIHGCCGCCVNK